MGRIKSALIKRTAKSLIKEPNKFSESFDNNKNYLGKDMPSKSLRNKIAGYLARLKRQEKDKKEKRKQETTD